FQLHSEKYPCRVWLALHRTSKWDKRLVQGFLFAQKEGEHQIRLYGIPSDELVELDDEIWDAYRKTLIAIRERFSTYRSSINRRFNNAALCEVVFNPDLLSMLLEKGIPLEEIEQIDGDEPDYGVTNQFKGSRYTIDDAL